MIFTVPSNPKVYTCTQTHIQEKVSKLLYVFFHIINIFYLPLQFIRLALKMDTRSSYSWSLKSSIFIHRLWFCKEYTQSTEYLCLHSLKSLKGTCFRQRFSVHKMIILSIKYLYASSVINRYKYCLQFLDQHLYVCICWINDRVNLKLLYTDFI